jgi:hypothetical protein
MRLTLKLNLRVESLLRGIETVPRALVPSRVFCPVLRWP